MVSSQTLRTGFWQRSRNELGLLIAIICVLLFTTFVDDSYREFPEQNAATILREISLLGIFALGAGIVIIAGGIDLSSGSVIAFSGMIFCSACLLLAPQVDGLPQTDQLPVWILVAALLITLLAAFLVGSFHAWL